MEPLLFHPREAKMIVLLPDSIIFLYFVGIKHHKIINKMSTVLKENAINNKEMHKTSILLSPHQYHYITETFKDQNIKIFYGY